MLRYKSKYKKVGVLPIRIAKSNVSSVGPSSEKHVKLHVVVSIHEIAKVLDRPISLRPFPYSSSILLLFRKKGP